MPISEKDIFATLMQDPNHAYQPLEKVWAEAVQRARQFRNNEKALSLAFDDSPALEKLLSYIQKAPEVGGEDMHPDEFERLVAGGEPGERVLGVQLQEINDKLIAGGNQVFRRILPWARSYAIWGSQIPETPTPEEETRDGQSNIYAQGKILAEAAPLIQRVKETIDKKGTLDEAFTPEERTLVQNLFDKEGNLHPRIANALSELNYNPTAKEKHNEALTQLAGMEAPSEMSREEALGSVGQDNPLTQDEPDIPEPEQATYDHMHPPEGETYALDFIGPVPEGGQQQSIHNTMRKLLTENKQYEPVDIEGKEGQTLKRYFELVDTSNPDWKFATNADEHPDINGETFAKLRDAGLVTGSSARGKWKWEEGTEALQELMKNMDRVRQVTETPVGDGVKFQSLKGQLHPALVDWLIDANAKGKLQPSYSEQEVEFHKSLGLGGGIQASPNEDLEAELAAEEAGEMESDDSEPEEGENPWLQYENPPMPVGLVGSTGENWLAPPAVEEPTNEQIEETVGNLADSTHADARYFPRKPAGEDGTKPYLFPRIDGEEFNPLEGDVESLSDNFKKVLKNFHAMNYKHNPDSLPATFGEYNVEANPFDYALKPNEWDDAKKAAYNEMRDNIGIHEGWLQGMIMAGLIPDTSVDVIYEPPLTNETWDDKGTIKKGQWNWVESLRGLGIVDDAGYPKFSALNHSEHGLDRGAGHGLVFQGVRRTGGRRGAGGGEIAEGGSFQEAINDLLTTEGIATPEQPYWAQAELDRKQAFMEDFGGTARAAEEAWEMWQASKGMHPGRFAGPEESEFRPEAEEGTEEDSETFHDFVRRILTEGHLGQEPDEVRQAIFGGEQESAPAGTEEVAPEEAAAPEAAPEAGPVEGGLGLESPDWGTTPGDITEPVVPETEEARLVREAAENRQQQIDAELQAAEAERVRLKEKRIDALMRAYPNEDEEYQADHKRELETNDKFLETEWANEIKRRASVGIKEQAKAEKDEAQAAKEEEKEASKPTPMDGAERKRLIQQIVDASKILHPGLEMSTEKQQLLEYISEHDEKGFRAEHAKIVNALETKQQADAKLHRTRDANNLDGFHGVQPLSSQQQPTEDDLIMQIRRIERWRKEHGADMSEASHQKLEELWNEANQFAANTGFDVDAQVNKDKEEAKQVGENHYGSSEWLDEVGKMHVDELGRKGNYDKQIAQGADLRSNRNYKPWLVIKYDRNGFGTFHDLRQRDENGDYGKQISPESLSFNEDDHYFDYKEEKEDLSQHPRAFDKFWNKIDRANFRPIDRRGFVERHGESGITSDTSGDRGEQTGWYHPESGSWVNPHRYREVRQALAQSGPGAGMMILNGSQFTGNHKRDGDDVHPKYGFAHRGDKTLADAGDDTNDFSYYVDGDGNIAHANADWDTVKQRDTNQIQDVNSVVHDWHSQNMNNMVRQDPASWQSSDGQSVLPGKVIQPRQGGEAPLQNMRLLKDVQEFDALARRRKQAGYDPSRMKNVGKTGLAADELGGMGQWWGSGAEARQKAFSALDYVGSGVLGFFGEMILGGKSKTDRMIQRARKQYKLHTEAESRTKDVMDNIKWHGQSVRYLSPGEGDARKEDLQRLRNHLSQQRVKHRNLQTEADSRKDTAGSQHSKEKQLAYSNDLNSLTGLDHELDSHWKHINSLYGNHMGGEEVHASMTPNVSEGSGAWADIFAQPSQQSEGPQEVVSSGLIGNAPGASGTPSISGGAGLIGGSTQENAPSREQIPSGVGLIG